MWTTSLVKSSRRCAVVRWQWRLTHSGERRKPARPSNALVGAGEEEVRTLLAKLEDRAEVLGLEYRQRDKATKLMDVTALATSLAHGFRLHGPAHRLKDLSLT